MTWSGCRRTVGFLLGCGEKLEVCDTGRFNVVDGDALAVPEKGDCCSSQLVTRAQYSLQSIESSQVLTILQSQALSDHV